MPAAPRRLASRLVYENPWMRLREDEIVWPDGSPGVYAVVEKRDSAVVAAVEGDAIWMVEQHRYTVGGRFWELPQGAMDFQGTDEDEPGPLAIAQAELREECGVTAREWQHLGRLTFAVGQMDQWYDGWLATGLERGETAREVSEQDMHAELVPLGDVRAMVEDGRIVDSATVVVLALAKLL